MKSFHNSVCVAALAAAIGLLAGPAHAQSNTAKASDKPDTGEIIVTAQKRAENVQNVPLAVSVLGASQLQAAGVRNFQDLGAVSPSLTIRPAEHPVNANVSLRGVGTFAFGIGVEPSVAVLVDEVPMAFQARAFTDLPDVERIEVLRGPQSTLYGKAASAGLINIITRGPSDTLKVRANATVTTDQEYAVNASVSGPISPTVGYVFSGAYSKWEGNVRNLFNGQKLNGREAGNFRAKLRWEPSSDAKLTLSLNYMNGNTNIGRPIIAQAAGALYRGTAGQTIDQVLPGVVVGPRNQNTSLNYTSRTKYQGGGGNIRGEFALGDHSLVTITSYDKFRLDDYFDSDETSSAAVGFNNIQVGTFKSTLFTQEVRLLSDGSKPFHYTVGAYYANVDFERPFYRGPAFSLANWNATSKSSQIAGFVQADWQFMPKATLTGGGRVQNEKIAYTFNDIQNGNARFNGSAEDTAATYRISARYEFTPRINAFVTYSTGYKGQTYDLTTGFNANRAAAGPIKPETSRDIEFGVRSQLFDRKVTLNVTYFDTSYKNLQAQSIETLADGTTNFRLTNVGKLGTHGFEIDAGYRPSSDFNFNTSLAILDAKYNDYPVAQCYPGQTAAQGCVAGTPSSQNLTGTRAVQAPQFKMSATAEYTPQIRDGLRGLAQVNVQHQSSVYYAARDPQTFQKGYEIVNLSLGIRDENRRWEVAAFVNNLFDQQYYPSLINSNASWGNAMTTQAVLPRDFRRYGGLRASLNF
ncbi:TonB-dependent receptor [Novosphingobium sediminicola]|uniref:Iron complex outermembrane receptor protein n=1 Tax=Novosphingobium sediminicola TaxID=563162 RepID=A0A7W6CR93_9SPHN|nr:TonB-dependent receptor [Novosphingobium sediminicola]MBB3957681.1 iron complex outermembrane receptor protein [Novosphingobium sediminicola]